MDNEYDNTKMLIYQLNISQIDVLSDFFLLNERLKKEEIFDEVMNERILQIQQKGFKSEYHAFPSKR